MEPTVAAAVCAAVFTSGIIAMTKEDHKSAIVQQLQQQSLNLLVDSLAAALAEIEQLKAAAADKPTP